VNLVARYFSPSFFQHNFYFCIQESHGDECTLSYLALSRLNSQHLSLLLGAIAANFCNIKRHQSRSQIHLALCQSLACISARSANTLSQTLQTAQSHKISPDDHHAISCNFSLRHPTVMRFSASQAMHIYNMVCAKRVAKLEVSD
jgi:hypothetical protein